MILNTLNIKKGRLICLFFVLFFLGCGPKSKEVTQEYKLVGNALGTTYHITYLGNQIGDLQGLIDSVIGEFNYGVSTYDGNSFISHYNGNKPLHVDDLQPGYQYFDKMISLSLPIVEATYGAFDPSAARLFGVYDAAKREKRFMDSAVVVEALSNKGLESVQFDSDGNMQNPRLKQMNFNAIAKGYFVDLLAAILEDHDVVHYMVEVGGEVHCKGNNSSGTAWNIGINRPEPGAMPTDYFEVISLSDQSMATSGNYQNYYVVNDSVIGHTLDPRSGKPVISDLKSATIIHSECAIADAYATACMVLGLEESIKMIEADSSLSAFFIYEKDQKLIGKHVK